MPRRFIWDIAVCAVFLLLCSLGYSLYMAKAQPVLAEEEAIAPGVSCYGYALGGLNYSGFSGLISACGAKVARETVVLRFNGREERISSSYGELGIFCDSERIWLEAVAVGNGGGRLERLWKRWQTKRHGYEVPLYLHIDEEQAAKTLKKYGLPQIKEAKAARLVVSEADKISIDADEWGADIDLNRALGELQEKIGNAGTDGGGAADSMGSIGTFELEVRLMEVRPQVIKSEIEAYRITGVLAAFSTGFNPQRKNRTKNIALAAEALDDCLLAPGEVFSFNNVVGPRTKERGYDEADIIMQNTLVPGVGGGVCQVSSTLYNVALLCGLEIVERHNHSMMITYVRPGLDSTVVYDGKDLKFRNTSGAHLLIRCRVSGNSLTVKVYGEHKEYEKRGRVVLDSEIEREIAPKTVYHEDPTVPKGQYILERQGEPGYIIKVERRRYDDKGVLLSTELICRDYYPPVDRVLRTLSKLDDL